MLHWPLAVGLVTLPVLTLFLAQGAVSVYGDRVHPVALIAASIVLFIIALGTLWIRFSKRKDYESERELVDFVDAKPDWGAHQLKVWQGSESYIDSLLEANDEFGAMPDHSLSVLRHISSAWNVSGRYIEYAASLPEVLLAIETLAARYRKVIIDNVPLSKKIQISKALSAWGVYQWSQDQYDEHSRVVEVVSKAWRAYKLTSLQGLFKEIGSALLGHLSEQAYANLVYNLKRAYLQEVASVGIDLYSGNFKRSIDELPFETDVALDLKRLASEVGPIRIVVVGQISSGKSSLVNVILDDFKAEAGLIPVTETDNVYKFVLADGLDTHVIDTPGMEADEDSIQRTVKRLSEADLVVWVMRANQPARSIDQSVFKAFNEKFSSEPDRQKPKVLVAATHVDCIPDFSNAVDNTVDDVTAPLARVCAEVVTYDVFCPLSLVEPRVGIHKMQASFIELYEHAVNTRLNRIRVIRPSFYESASEEIGRLCSGSINALKLARRKAEASTSRSS